MAQRDKRGWSSHCRNTIAHLLKIEYSPSRKSIRHWHNEINNFRHSMYRYLRSKPGMKGRIETMLQEAWIGARSIALNAMIDHSTLESPSSETRLHDVWDRRIPVDCPYTTKEIIGYDLFDRKAKPSKEVWPAEIAVILKKRLRAEQSIPPDGLDSVAKQQHRQQVTVPRIKEDPTMNATHDIQNRAASKVSEPRQQVLYDEDIWSWSREQVKAMRERRHDDVDWENVIEEIESIGRDCAREWTWSCAGVIENLLKIEYGRSRELVRISRHEAVRLRIQMNALVRESLGMSEQFPEMLPTAWEYGREDAVRELAFHEVGASSCDVNDLMDQWESRLPEICPYSLAEVAGCDAFSRDARPDFLVWPTSVAQILNQELRMNIPVRGQLPVEPDAEQS